MPEKKGLGIIIMGKPKGGMMGKGKNEEMDEEAPETSAFDDAAAEAFSALKDEDKEGFSSALRLAIESLL